MRVDLARDQKCPGSGRLHQGRSEGHGRHLYSYPLMVEHLQGVSFKLDAVDLWVGTKTNKMPGHHRALLAHV